MLSRQGRSGLFLKLKTECQLNLFHVITNLKKENNEEKHGIN